MATQDRIVQISKDEAKIRLKLAKDQQKALEDTAKELQKLLSSGKGNVQVQTSARANLLSTTGKLTALNRRIELLKKNFDLAPVSAKGVQAPVNRSYVAQQVKEPRKPLVLPRAYSVPSSAVTKLIAQKIVAQAPKIAGETKAQTAIRQKELVKRALVRAVNAQTQQAKAAAPITSQVAPVSPSSGSDAAYTTCQPYTPMPSTQTTTAIVDAAVAQTIQQDAQIIAAETQVAGPAGGVAPDQTADQMAPIVEAAVVEAQMDASGSSSSSGSGAGLLMAGAAAALGLFAYTRGWIG